MGDFIISKDLKRFLLNRPAESHKGDFGYVLVVGGSEKYSGAPALAGLAALRTGADLATVLAPSCVANVIRGFSPNLIVFEYAGKYLNRAAVREFSAVYEKYDSFVIGPGLGNADAGALRSVVKKLKAAKKKFVVDADALKILKPADLAGCRCVITPHAQEYMIFAGKKKPAEFDFCVLQKGATDFVFYKGRRAENKTGNPGMTVGGTGDVLSGIIAALLANTDDLFEAAKIGAWICGTAGDLAYADFGYSLLATDVIEKIPAAIRRRSTASL